MGRLIGRTAGQRIATCGLPVSQPRRSLLLFYRDNFVPLASAFEEVYE
jgi:hypothetical protein